MTRPIEMTAIGVSHSPYQDNYLYFSNVDMFDGTLLLDIKPYSTHFDCFNDAKYGWIDKHFAAGEIPDKALKKGF